MAILSSFGREASLVNIIEPGPYFQYCLHPLSIYCFIYFSVAITIIIIPCVLILCKQQGRRNGRLLCTRWEQSYLLCVQVQEKQVIIFKRRITCRTTYLSILESYWFYTQP